MTASSLKSGAGRRHAGAGAAQGRRPTSIVNDLDARYRAFQLETMTKLQTVDGSRGSTTSTSAFNLRDPILRDVRVRQALGVCDRSTGDHRVLAPWFGHRAALGLLPRHRAWAFERRMRFHFPVRSGRRSTKRSSMKPAIAIQTATVRCSRLSPDAQDFQHARVQSTAGGCHPAGSSGAVGVDLEIRTYEFATLYADVIKGQFQLYSLQWTAGSRRGSGHSAARVSFDPWFRQPDSIASGISAIARR